MKKGSYLEPENSDFGHLILLGTRPRGTLLPTIAGTYLQGRSVSQGSRVAALVLLRIYAEKQPILCWNKVYS
jgi:hypothetical protein